MNNIPTKVSYTGLNPLDPITSMKSEKSTLAAVGLNNLGNTCFLNSVVQCLAHVSYLTEFCRSDQVPRNKPLGVAFADLIVSLHTAQSAISPTNFKAQIGKYARQFVGYAQHDAQEFLRCLLDYLNTEWSRVEKKAYVELEDRSHLTIEEQARLAFHDYAQRYSSIVADCFNGFLRSTLTCCMCGFQSVTFDAFWDLSLPIPQQSGPCSLMDCFREFTKAEVILIECIYIYHCILL